MALCIPFIGVPDIEQTINWYLNLGFSCTGSNRYWEPGSELVWAQLEWEGAAFMLFPSMRDSRDDIRDAGLYFKVKKMDGLIDKLKQCARIIEVTEASIYGKDEVVFEDLNGYRITFTCDPF